MLISANISDNLLILFFSLNTICRLDTFIRECLSTMRDRFYVAEMQPSLKAGPVSLKPCRFRCAVNIDGLLSEWFSSIQRVHQGDVMSMFLYCIYNTRRTVTSSLSLNITYHILSLLMM